MIARPMPISSLCFCDQWRSPFHVLVMMLLVLSMQLVTPRAQATCRLTLSGKSQSNASSIQCTGGPVSVSFDSSRIPGFETAGVQLDPNCTVPGKSCLLTFCNQDPTHAATVVIADISNVQALEPAVTGIVCLAGHARVTFTDSTFNDNCAFSVLHAQDSSQLSINNSAFTGSCARESLAPCRSERSYPDDPGGAVLAAGAAAIDITDSFFQANKACRGGAIALTESATLNMSSSSFKSNRAIYGADVFTEGAAYMAARNCTFADGSSGFGALCLVAGAGPDLPSGGSQWNLLEDSSISVSSDPAIYQQGSRPLALRNTTIQQARATSGPSTRSIGGIWSDAALTIAPDSVATVYLLQNTSINGADLCNSTSSSSSSSSSTMLEQACMQLASAAALVCIFPNGSAASAHGAARGYFDVCINPNRFSYLVIAYSIFGAVMLLLFASVFSAWVCKKCTSTYNRPAGSTRGTSSGLDWFGEGSARAQGFFASSKGHHLLVIARVTLAGYDIVSDVVAMYFIKGSSAVGSYIAGLLAPIFIASTILHAKVCHDFMQRKRHVPPSLWPYKMYSRCHPAVAGVFGWVCPFPIYLCLMHFPTMLLHAIQPRKWCTWLELHHYASLYSFLSAAIQSPISIGIISAAALSGTSEDLFPRMVTGWVFFFTIASSMASIVVWTAIILSAAAAGKARQLFREIFWELVVPLDSAKLPGGGGGCRDASLDQAIPAESTKHVGQGMGRREIV